VNKKPHILFFKLFLILMPLLLLIIYYIIADPFKVIYSYDTYYNEKNREMFMNRDHVSTRLYLSNYPKYRYDSFILGSSRSFGFTTKEWQKYIPSPSSPFHFDAGSESLFGIYTKIRYLCRNDRPMKNCLVILDSTLIAKTENEETLNQIKNPEVSGESCIKYQYKFLSSFLTGGFFVPYIAWKAANIDKGIFDFIGIIRGWYYTVDYSTNDVDYTEQEKLISENSENYYVKMGAFIEKDTVNERNFPVLIKDKQLKLLHEMKNSFDKCGTSYKIVLCPDFNGVKFHESDYKNLQDIFGKENVFDFSGLNEISKHKEYYIDPNHMRIIASNKMLQVIYGQTKQEVIK